MIPESRQAVKDKMLRAVLLDEKLMEHGGYTADECESMDLALGSENAIVHAVATIIERYHDKANENEIYKEVSDYLRKKI